jgi:hypothetical protein
MTSAQNAPIASAFGYAAEKFLRQFGNGPYDGLRTIGDVNGQGFAMTANITAGHEPIGNIPWGHIMIYHNGIPCGCIMPYGGSLMSMGEPGLLERDFIAWCREDEGSRSDSSRVKA